MRASRKPRATRRAADLSSKDDHAVQCRERHDGDGEEWVPEDPEVGDEKRGNAQHCAKHLGNPEDAHAVAELALLAVVE